MVKSKAQFLFEAQQLTPDERRKRLEQLDPNSPTLAAAHAEELNAALHNNVYLIGVSPDVRDQRTAVLGKQIADALVSEFEALELATRGAEQRQLLMAANAGWFPMMGARPEIQTEQLRAALELIRPKVAPNADVSTPEFDLPENQEFFRRKDIQLWARKNGLGKSNRNINGHLKEKTDFAENEELTREAFIDFLRTLRRIERGP